MRKAILITSMLGLSALCSQAMAAELKGEWANSADECDQLRTVYADGGEHLTKMNVEGNWQLINESLWERNGDDLYITTDGHVAEWVIDKLDGEELHLVNQDPEAEELGVGEARFVRCD
jgi:hypothetical protein